MANDSYFLFDDDHKMKYNIIKDEMDKLKSYSPIYCIKSIERIDLIVDKHLIEYTW